MFSDARRPMPDSTPTAHRRDWSLLWTWALVGLAFLLPVVLLLTTGAVTIPHNDAWSHARIAQTWASEGRIELFGWNRSALLGMVIPLGPLGESLVAQHVFVVCCAAVAVWSTYQLVQVRGGVAAGALAALCLVAIPEFGLLSTSYMTDVPAMAGAVLAVHLTDRMLRDVSWGYGLLALGVALWSMTVRDQMLIAVASVLCGALVLGRRKKMLRLAAGFWVVACVVVVTFQMWRRSLPNGDPPALDWSVTRLEFMIPILLASTAFYLLPFLVGLIQRWSVLATVSAGVVLLGALTWVAVGRGVRLGNYVGVNGAYADVAPNRLDALGRVVIPSAVLDLVILATCVASALLAGVIVEHRKALRQVLFQDAHIAIPAGLYLAGTLIQNVAGQGVFSRYLLILVPLIAALVAGATRVRRLPVILTAVPLVVLGMVLTVTAMTYDTARWEAAEKLVQEGVPAQEIDAGLEWVGMHSPSGASVARDPTAYGWYDAMFDLRRCYLVTPRERVGWDLHQVLRYRTFMLAGQGTLYTYRFEGCAVPAHDPAELRVGADLHHG